MADAFVPGETVPTDETPVTPEAVPNKRTFPTKTFVKFAVATTAAAIIGGYVVKKTVCEKHDDEEQDESDGWTIVPMNVDATSTPTSD